MLHNCPEHTHSFVVLLKRAKKTEERKAKHEHIQERRRRPVIVWFEIPADNLDRAKTFYGKLFGWKINPFPGMPGPEAQQLPAH